jgi:hypothetical protein
MRLTRSWSVSFKEHPPFPSFLGFGTAPNMPKKMNVFWDMDTEHASGLFFSGPILAFEYVHRPSTMGKTSDVFFEISWRSIENVRSTKLGNPY